MASSFRPVLTGEGRVFVNPDGQGCGRPYRFHNCMKIDALDKSLGDVTPIYCPDESRYDQFVEVASIKGADSRYTSTLTGRLPVDSESVLEYILRKGCTFNMQVHYGKCAVPSDFNDFEVALIFQDVRLTSYALTPLVALTPDERAIVDESSAISIGNYYRVFSLTRTQTGQNLTTAAGTFVGEIVWCDSANCGDCGITSDGCQLGFVLQATGSQTNIGYTIDGGLSWNFKVIGLTSALNNQIEESSLTCDGSNIHVAYRMNGTTTVVQVIPIDEIVGVGSPLVTTVLTATTTYEINIPRNSSSYVYYFGTASSGGEVIYVNDKSTGLIELLSYDTVNTNFTTFSASVLNDDNVLIGGGNGQYIYSNRFGAFNSGTITIDGVPQLERVNDVAMLTDRDWIAVLATQVVCTSDRGQTWSRALSIGSTGKINFVDNILGYLRTGNEFWRTLDGGNSWKRINSINGLPTPRRVSICPGNPNVILVSGGPVSTGGAGWIERYVN